MKLPLTSIFICGISLAANAASAPITLESVGERLVAVASYADSARYEVLLPNLAEPVEYELCLESTAAPGDTLSSCCYFIDWSLSTPTGSSTGFSAYFDGNHFRQRDERLQEYHYSETPEVFAPVGDISRGVHRQAQFVELLPQNIGMLFIDMAADSSYIYKVTSDTLVSGIPSFIVEGIRRISGFDCAEYVYVLDRESLLPRRIELENNPGQLGEQAITVEYAGARRDII